MQLILQNRYPIKYLILELFLVYCIMQLIKPFSEISVDMWDRTSTHFRYYAISSFKIFFLVYFAKLTSSSCFRTEFHIPKFKIFFLWTSFCKLVKYLFFFMFLMMILSFVLWFVPYELSYNFFNDSLIKFNWKFGSLTSVFLMIITSFFIGAYEELFYRAYLITKLSQAGLSNCLALLLSSLLFGLGHLYYGSLGFIVSVIFGYILGFVYLNSKNIYESILIHSFYNVIVVIVKFILII